MKSIIVLALALLIVASSSYGVYRLLESFNPDDELGIEAESTVLPGRPEQEVRRTAMAQDAKPSVTMVPAPKEVSAPKETTEPTEESAPDRRDPEVLRQLRPWWTEKAKELQTAVARRAQSGASSADIQEMMESFQAQVAAQYDRVAAEKSSALSR